MKHDWPPFDTPEEYLEFCVALDAMRCGETEPLIQFLNRGRPLHVSAAKSLADTLSEVHVAPKKPAHRPVDHGAFWRTFVAAKEVRRRVRENGDKISHAIAAVRAEYVIRKGDLDKMVAELDRWLGPLPRDPRGRKRRAL